MFAVINVREISWSNQLIQLTIVILVNKIFVILVLKQECHSPWVCQDKCQECNLECQCNLECLCNNQVCPISNQVCQCSNLVWCNKDNLCAVICQWDFVNSAHIPDLLMYAVINVREISWSNQLIHAIIVMLVNRISVKIVQIQKEWVVCQDKCQACQCNNQVCRINSQVCRINNQECQCNQVCQCNQACQCNQVCQCNNLWWEEELEDVVELHWDIVLNAHIQDLLMSVVIDAREILWWHHKIQLIIAIQDSKITASNAKQQ